MDRLLFLLTVSGARGCSTVADCSLNGACSAGRCACNRGWTGTTCGALDLAPLDPTLGYQNSTAASWGGRAVLVGSGAAARWHMAVTEIANKCPLILFMYNSQVVHTVSRGPSVGGPYDRVADSEGGVILPAFHHNPSLIGPTPDGMYLIFFIGAPNATGMIDCRSVLPDVNPHPDPLSNGYITMAWAKDVVNGPWQSRVVLQDNGPGENQTSWHCIENNPSAVVLPNGTVVMTYRANGCDKSDKATSGEHLGIAVAPHWSGEFVRDPSAFVGPETSNGTNNEDPFMWHQVDPDTGAASWHIVNHQQSKNNVCGSREAGSTCGAHWYAHSPHGPWTMSPEPAYNASVRLINGSSAIFKTRQRPQLVFEADGATPLALFNGASFEGNNPDLHMLTHTFAFTFNGRGNAAP